MKTELAHLLIKCHPKIFALCSECRTNMDPSSFSTFEFECEDGWYDLIDTLAAQLQWETDQNNAPQLIALQVKEKLGELRFYAAPHEREGANDVIRMGVRRQSAIIEFATTLSRRICEVCGAPGKLDKQSGWLSTRCALHRKNSI